MVARAAERSTPYGRPATMTIRRWLAVSGCPSSPVTGDRGEPRGEQPVPQFGEAEQPLDERQAAGPATSDDGPLRFEPAGQCVQVVAVDEHVAVVPRRHDA